MQNIHPWRTRLWFNVGHTCRWNIFQKLSTGLGTIQIKLYKYRAIFGWKGGAFERSGIVEYFILAQDIFSLVKTFKGNFVIFIFIPNYHEG